MRWPYLVTGCLAVLLAVAGLVTAGSTNSVDASHVKTVNIDGSSAQIEFTSPVELAWAASTGSMQPTFGADALLVAAPDKLQVGDIIIYDKAGELIVHRIIGIEHCGDELCYSTKGDANWFADDPVPSSAIRWKVIGVLY